MASIKEVRERITSVSSTQQITKAMKMVAAAKLKRAQDAINQMRPYAKKLTSILDKVSAGLVGTEVVNEYATERTIKKVLIVAITSDRGLCGAFNSSVFKGVNALIADKYADLDLDNDITILSIGKKADEFFVKRNYNVISDYALLFGALSFEKASKATDFVMNGFIKGDFDAVEVVFNESKNVATQIIHQDQFLPMVVSSSSLEDETANIVDYIFEPTKEELVSDLIPTSLKVTLYKAVLESNAAEHGARMTAMDKATDNAGEMLKELKLQYNRSRQASITNEILEIVGGAEALSN